MKNSSTSLSTPKTIPNTVWFNSHTVNFKVFFFFLDNYFSPHKHRCAVIRSCWLVFSRSDNILVSQGQSGDIRLKITVKTKLTHLQCVCVCLSGNSLISDTSCNAASLSSMSLPHTLIKNKCSSAYAALSWTGQAGAVVFLRCLFYWLCLKSLLFSEEFLHLGQLGSFGTFEAPREHLPFQGNSQKTLKE